MKGSAVQTPLMRQYYKIKEKHPDAVLLFRVGDFYETFEKDAIKTSEILGITLTRRANGAASSVELAGFPYHALDTYLPKLVRAGQRVAICEQLEDPKQAKTIVKRGITELVTPGTTINENILNGRENNFLASVYFDNKLSSVAFLDLSTGEFFVAEGTVDYIDKLLQSFNPKEILFEKDQKAKFKELFDTKAFPFGMDEWAYEYNTAYDILTKRFETQSLKGFGIENFKHGVIAAGVILHYLELTHHKNLGNITSLSRIDEDRFVWLDKFTIRNLEVFEALHEKGKSLVQTIDNTLTPMGSRLFKRWFALPLKQVQTINDRHNVVSWFLDNRTSMEDAQSYIRKVGDLERLITKVAVLRINPRELVALGESLTALEPLKELLGKASEPVLKRIAEQIQLCKIMIERIEKEINPTPPPNLTKGDVIAHGVNAELDKLRNIAFTGKDYLSQLQEKYSSETGIPSLKIAFNNVFGYYIEVRNTHKNKVPSEWIRKQTLVSAERYITPELKEYEEQILGAEEKIIELEKQLFNDLIVSLTDYVASIQLNANLIARLDCLQSFATVAISNNYCRPEVTDSLDIDIKQGRHPVIETHMPLGEEYVANDVFINNDDQQIIIITGPNMSGKSALLRQTALITLMAQVGCYVPAKEAKIGVVDKIFTRVGASDNISLGESTFMVEMNEAASILNNLSERSLVLFDELGRGTSTYDGISIAWSIVEYLHEHTKHRPKTMFATHYHELNEMESTFKRIKNYNVSVREVNNKIIFLRKLVRGGSEHSFGIHVAKMAGMPPTIVKRAEQILSELEGSAGEKKLTKPVKDLGSKREGYQLSIFQLDDPTLMQIRNEIKNLDINNITPLEALNKLNEIKKIIGLK
ncbi:MAG: DNA mismatch repair protein MutS [Salinivirgaceae bacterium]|jgi:DNA mismatch repair protein MutS|nr:DNA mismatch repair protein MutS [Bacteroidales bacterium]